jgi:hypothetical protein
MLLISLLLSLLRRSREAAGDPGVLEEALATTSWNRLDSIAAPRWPRCGHG